ncbi:sensor histidine kinase [Coprobacter tertius]|uniref:histidine kinase n=1 Tax=Coprobacter tertius TaxID=2944915 RepID=A0ABT1MGY2_9BACT|nr:HAMP domain-containing sensor histidine kinase [Coprobacter tertius]MCP9611892.1 HAMP domain-containing histidine kinase [Coprobacter tertius]
MKLIYRVALRLSVVLLPLIALWAVLFYFTMIEEINDEADDSLEDYSELIIIRMLAGRELPSLNNGSNNSYSITPVNKAYADSHPHIDYYDAEVYIPEKEETEPARILTTIFMDNQGVYYELKVATPTFEKDDLLRAILYWIVILYFLLLIVIIGVTLWVFHRSMRPLYDLLHWLDSYMPGKKNTLIPDNTRIPEFRKLNAAAQQAVDRSEELFEQQKQFIGNASHELQTPLAVLGNRLEWLLDNTELTEEQMNELFKMQRTLSHIIKLNKTLLFLSKIENGQFPENDDIDIASMIGNQIEVYDEIYASRKIVCETDISGSFIVKMNESLGTTLVTNLIKNAYVHTPEGGNIKITVNNRTLSIENDGNYALDAERIFDRFYQGNKKEGSTGLGLSLVNSVVRYYGLHIEYRFSRGRHCFTVVWP